MSNITKLEDHNGIRHSDKKGLEKICLHSYSSLYLSCPQSTAKAKSKGQAFRYILERIL